MVQSIYEKREENALTLEGFAMEQLFDEKNRFFFRNDGKIDSFRVYLECMRLLKISWSDMERIETLISEITKRFPKKLAKESIQAIRFLANEIPYSQLGLEITLQQLPEKNAELVLHELNEKYPLLMAEIRNS